jgi:UDP-glucose:(glucosyl)LPS alpha-1,2-glucosyltransferase
LASPGIAILLPEGERFAPEGAGAVALWVRDTSRASRHRAAIRIYGHAVARPFEGLDFRALAPAWGGRLGRNLGLAEGLRRELDARADTLVELHNRPHLVHYLALRAPRLPLALRLANDPRTMRGGRTTWGRTRLLRHARAVYCVSDHIRRRLVDGIAGDHAKAHLLITGIERAGREPPEKEKLILYVGRINPDKGVDDLVSALEAVLPHHPDWRAEIVGTSATRRDPATSPYERALRARTARLGAAVRWTGALTNDEVLARQRRAAIAVLPSRWPEPMARTAVEALAQGCAVLAYPSGGLPEVVAGRGLLIDPPGAAGLGEALDRLLADEASGARLRDRAWQDYPFDLTSMVARLDRIRDGVFARMAGGG